MSRERVVLPALPALAALVLGYGPAGTAPGSPSGTGPAGDVTRGAAVDTAPPKLPPPTWQQRVHYTVEARLDEEADLLEAAGTVRYENASSDTLRRLYFHLYLNAFRPNSVWARNEKREAYDYQSLEEPDYGFERLRSVRLTGGPGVGEGSGGGPGARTADGGGEARGSRPTGGEGTRGVPLTPRYPHAPDSTVVRLELPGPLPPGGRLALRMRWDARPSTLCRRQCRRERHWDFAQWYPRVAVYDRGGWEAHPLYPQGEFYGEFGTYDVTLDLAKDQVVGATGVPVEGDPGWRPLETSPTARPAYRRRWYGDRRPARSPGFLEEAADSDRRRVRFYAEDVHHFAWSASPEFRYEGAVYERGALPDVAVHALLLPGDTTWDDGVAVDRNVRVLSWLQSVFRPYPYPQVTWLHRLEGGATEFPCSSWPGA